MRHSDVELTLRPEEVSLVAFATRIALHPDTSWRLCLCAFIMKLSCPALRGIYQASKLTNKSIVAYMYGYPTAFSALLQFHTPYQDS